MHLEKRHFDEIVKANSNSLVGRVCARIEEIAKVEGVSEEKKIELIKSSVRNFIPEAMRDMKFQLECYEKGLQAHKITFAKPTDSAEKQS